MIFVTLGSQKFQFNRLLMEIDKLVEERIIREEVFAQIGYSDYKPKNYKYKEFLNRDEFSVKMDKCDKVITHGGTGAIIGAIKMGKRVISIPRLSKYGEHVDDHQLQIVNQFSQMNYIRCVYDEKNLKEEIMKWESQIISKYESNTMNIINEIENFIENE